MAFLMEAMMNRGTEGYLLYSQSTKCACIIEIAAPRVDGIDHLSPCPLLSPYLFEAGGVLVAVYFKGKHDNLQPTI